MKIALVILHADPTRGGAERYTIDLAAALVKRGHDTSILATTFASIPERINQIALDASGLTRSGRYRAMLNSLDVHLNQNKYDIVHAMLPIRQCDVYHPHAGIAADSLVKTGGIALPFNPRRRAFAKVERQLLTGSNLPVVLCLSDYVKNNVTRYFPAIPTNKLLTLFNAVDLARFEPRAHDSDSNKVSALMIANDFDRKGLAETIRAVAKLREPKLRLDVYGKEDTRKYSQLSIELGIADSIRFHGMTSDPREAYRQADFFVLPTKHDPCSLVVLEALAIGVPVISTRLNGACEIMTDGVHGFVLPDPNDINALAEAMRKMIDPQARAQLSAACLELRPRLSYEHHLDRLIQIYEQCTV